MYACVSVCVHVVLRRWSAGLCCLFAGMSNSRAQTDQQQQQRQLATLATCAAWLDY